ncbi:MAG: alpha-amylase [Verrucomicrobia bacterium]|nr:MAG: alpha-amylase [Verrucomicrobiota bacterium]
MRKHLRLPLLAFAAAAHLLFAGSVSGEPLLWNQPSTELPEWMRNQTIYEVNVRQYSKAGTFSAVEADLDRLERLGAGVLWFMPIHPIGKVNRKGTLGSYYSVADYRAVNPEFGTEEDLRSLVDAAHARGMRVILDWVGNHTAWDHPYTRTHPEYYVRDADGNFTPPTGTDWTDVIQLNFDHPGVLQFQIEAMRYWVTEFGIDGFRCDFARGVPTPFWNALAAALRETRPDLFLLAEAEEPDHQLHAFHAAYGWEMMHGFNAIAQGRAPASHIDDILARQRLRFPAGSDFLYLTSNHDENTWNGTVFERLGGGAEVFAALTFVLDGIPLVYNGQEAGLEKRLEFFERDPIPWRDHRLFEVYRTLIDLKKTHPALRTGAPAHRLATTANEAIYALLRGTPEGPRVLFIGNLTATDTAVSLGSELLRGEWTDVFTGETLSLDANWSLKLQSWKYRLLQTPRAAD